MRPWFGTTNTPRTNALSLRTPSKATVSPAWRYANTTGRAARAVSAGACADSTLASKRTIGASAGNR